MPLSLPGVPLSPLPITAMPSQKGTIPSTTGSSPQHNRTHRLPYVESTSEAHMAASEFMLTLADQLWAVWDGKPARGFGGTADVVQAARDAALPVRIIWPDGAQRD